MTYIYFIIRLINPTEEILPVGIKTTGAGVEFAYFLINSILLVLSMSKMMFLLRINETFGMLVELINQSIRDS